MSVGVQKKSRHPLNYHENGINNYEKLPQENKSSECELLYTSS